VENKTLTLKIGVKSDPIERIHSFNWLFDLMVEEAIFNLQLGSFMELYFLSDNFFVKLRKKAEARNIKISSIFTSHRECGFMYEDPEFIRITQRNYKRLIEIAEILGSPSVGSSIGGVLRDRLDYRKRGLDVYIEKIKEIMHYAKVHKLEWLTMEPMSCFAEPPCNSKELVKIASELMRYHKKYPEETVKFGLCADVSHGWANKRKEVIENNIDYFIAGIPYMYEFHFKNTDRIYYETFGFEPENIDRGIVDVSKIHEILLKHYAELPVAEIVGYLEIPGPKIGRDYTDSLLGRMIRESLRYLKKEFLKDKD